MLTAHRSSSGRSSPRRTHALNEVGKYVFEVAQTANKIEIKRAVEEVFKVKVKAVNIMNVPGQDARVCGRHLRHDADLEEGDRDARRRRAHRAFQGVYEGV